MQFGNIFSKPVTTSISNNRIATETQDFNLTSSLMEYLVSMEDDFFGICQEHLMITHMALKDDDMSILEEGFKDFIHSAVEFFKKMIDKFKEFMRKVFMYLHAYMGNFDKFLEKYKDIIMEANPDFSVYGYQYSFKSGVPRIDMLKSIVAQYNGELDSVSKKTKDELMSARVDFISESNLRALRGSIIGKEDSISSEDYLEEVRHSYRSGDKEPIEIRVTKSLLTNLVSGYSDLKKSYKDCAKDRDETIVLLESMKNFFERKATINYKDDSRKLHARQLEIDDNGRLKQGESQYSSSESSNIEKYNLFFNFKWIQSKEIGGMCVTAMTEKVNALKEAMKQSQNIIRKSIFGRKDTSEVKNNDKQD